MTKIMPAARRSGAISAILFAIATLGAAPANATEPVSEPASAADNSQGAIERFEAFLERYPESSTRAEVLYTLGQLHEERETAEALRAEDQSGVIAERIAHPNSIRCYEEIVHRFPAFADREAVLYRLGFLAMESGNDPLSGEMFALLLHEFPGRPYAASAMVRIGELAVRRDDPAAAAAAFGDAIAAGADTHAEKLHFRHAWSLYRAREIEAARSAILTGIDAEWALDPDPDVGFFREMIHLLADIQAEFDGLAGAQSVAASLPAPARRSFLADLGQLLEEEDRSEPAIDYLDLAIAAAPEHVECPALAQAAIRAATKVGPDPISARRMARFEADYRAGSRWRSRNALPPEESQRLDGLCEENVYRAGIMLYEAAREEGEGDTEESADLLAEAMSTLRRAVERYPSGTSRDEAYFLLAEAERSIEAWEGALADYAAVRLDGLKPERLEKVLYGRVLAHEELRREIVAGGGEETEPARQEALREVDAIEAYIASHPNADEASALSRKRADLLVLGADREGAARAYEALFEQSPPKSAQARELAGLVGAQLAALERLDDAVAWFDRAGDPARAAAAIYSAAEKAAEAGEKEAGGLALLGLIARYPGSKLAFAARLDAIDLLAGANAIDTLTTWVEASGAGVASGPGQADSLSKRIVAAAAHAESRDRELAARLYLAGARFTTGDDAVNAIARAGNSLRLAGRREEAATTLASAVTRFPGEAALAPLFLAVDLQCDTLSAPQEAVAFLESARDVARHATLGHRVAWERRLGHALIEAGRPNEGRAAHERALVLYERGAAQGSLPAHSRERAVSDSLSLEREVALAALALGNLQLAELPEAAPGESVKKATAQWRRERADEIVATYAFVMKRAFRDLTSQAGYGAGQAMERAARAWLERGLATQSSADIDAARDAATRATEFYVTVASLPVESADEWIAQAAASIDLREELLARCLAHFDAQAAALVSVWPPELDMPDPSHATGVSSFANAKEASQRIVELAELAELLAPVRDLALDHFSYASEAMVALRQGALYEQMSSTLWSAPVPDELAEDELAVYLKAVQTKSDEFNQKAAACYRASLDRADAAGAASASHDALRMRIARLNEAPPPASLTQRP